MGASAILIQLGRALCRRRPRSATTGTVTLTPTFQIGEYMIRVEYKAADKWIGLYDPPPRLIWGELWERDWYLVIRPQYPIHIRRVYHRD